MDDRGSGIRWLARPSGRRPTDRGEPGRLFVVDSGTDVSRLDARGSAMSILLVGVSHHSAPVSLLETVAVAESDRDRLTAELLDGESVREVMIVTTCNRVEVYSAVEAFHPALDEVVSLLARHSGLAVEELSRHLYVRYGRAAAEHLFSVASGLDSMVVGEQQIIGQIRGAYQAASVTGAAGRTLHRLAQQALHVGKRVHTETAIDSAGASVVSVALDRAARVLAADSGGVPTLSGRRAVVLGAGAMGGLAVAHLGRGGVAHIDVANRTPERAERLSEIARAAGTPAAAVPVEALASVVADADVFFTCTGAVGSVVSLADVHTALAARAPGRPLVICDLGLPRDVDPAVAGLPGVTVLGIETLKADPGTAAASADADAARTIVGVELEAYTSSERVAEVGPIIGELRGRAGQIVTAELRRLDQRAPGLGGAEREEVERTLHRIVEKLLHPPTVRFKELASQPDGEGVTDVMRALFDLDVVPGGRA